MTPEEKAERYDKATKEVKDFFEGKHKMYSDITQTLEYLFPELKESEDEKIRKAIISGMTAIKKQGKETFAAIRINDCITWLEKQGEQKPQGKTALEAIKEEKVDNQNCVKSVNKTVEEYNITGIGSKHAQGKLGEMIKKLKDETSIAVNNPDAYKIGFADGEAHAKEEQWKPSDEQIKHLTYVVNDAKHKNRISTNGYEPYSYLYSLLMQLKKLKG